VTRYTPLFAKPGTFILELDNIVQTGLVRYPLEHLMYNHSLHLLLVGRTVRQYAFPFLVTLIPIFELHGVRSYRDSYLFRIVFQTHTS